MRKPYSEILVAEVFGILVLILIGCGSAILVGGHIGFLGVSLAFVLAAMVMAYTIGYTPGYPLNTAIAISMLAMREIDGKAAIAYFIPQTVGPFAGPAIINFVVSGNPHYNLAVNGVGQNSEESESPNGHPPVIGGLLGGIYGD